MAFGNEYSRSDQVRLHFEAQAPHAHVQKADKSFGVHHSKLFLEQDAGYYYWGKP